MAVCIGWIIFRAASMDQIYNMTMAVFTFKGSANFADLLPLVKFAGPLMLLELLQVWSARDDVNNLGVPVWTKATVYAVLFYLFVFYGASAQSFIYFQF